MTRFLSLTTALVLLAATAPSLGQSPARPATPPPASPPPLAQAAAPSASPSRLPVRRVVLYKSGVGYFEHLGKVVGTQTVSLDLTSGQLNDMLMSLTALDLGGGEVSSITYNTVAPIEEQLATLRLTLGAEVTRAQLLEALRGARVEVRAGGVSVSGRILDVATKTIGKEAETRALDELTIVGDGGDVRAFDLVPGVAVTLVEAELRRDLGQYLDVVGTSRGADVRKLQLSARGTGTRDLFVSYVSAVPVWKMTYRLVVPTEGARKPFLQGWAIVDNTLGMDWTDVELSLVAGAPQSFVQPLSQPIYTERPMIPVQTGAIVAPEIHGGAMAEERAPEMKMALPTPRSEFRAREGTAMMRGEAGGALGGVVGGVPAGPPPPPPAPAPARIADALTSMQVAAEGANLGELFEYRLKQPVTIRRHQSALIPVVQHDVGVERVSLWSTMRGVTQPMRALWLTNDTGLTLDGGSVTLVEGNAFAGSGLIEAIKPGEKRFVSYAVDLGVRVTAVPQDAARRVSRIRIASSVMTQSVEERSSTLYTVRNDDATPRDVVIEHPVRAGWSLTGAVKPAESSATAHRFKVPIAPKSTATLTVGEMRPVDSRVTVSTISDDQIAVILRGKGAAAGLEPQLRAVAAKSREVAQVQRGIADRQGELTRITQDQTRVRENLKALEGTSAEKALVERYARQLSTQEDRLEVLRKEIEAAEAERAAKQQELTQLVAALSVDVELP